MKKEYLKYKKYAHFDRRMSVKKAKAILKKEDTIKKHGFFPFIHYSKKYKKLEVVNNKTYSKKERKNREIYYCAHLDRYIYQHYAHLLGLKYNEYAIANNIDKCSGAYRIDRGKCNIDFSYEMFECIKEKKEAIIVVGDFTKFFDNLNHNNLKKRLEILLDGKLDNNLYKVFKSLTKFKYIDLEDLYNYYTTKNNKRSEKYYIRRLDTLMTRAEFKKFIKSKNTVTDKKYLNSNNKNYGIVQGSPMSGLLANIYMIDFDKYMNELATEYNGKYLRYSDDFMLILGELKTNEEIYEIYNKIQQGVAGAGQIELEKQKTSIYKYKNKKIKCLNEDILNIKDVPNVVNFLGFSFDGKNVFVRDKTMTKYFYKMERKIKKYVKGKDNITIKNIYDKFSSQGENKKNSNGNKGNFITYIKRAEKKFVGELKISNIRKKSKQKVNEKIGKIKSKLK